MRDSDAVSTVGGKGGGAELHSPASKAASQPLRRHGHSHGHSRDSIVPL